MGDDEEEPSGNDPDSVAEPDRLDPRAEDSGPDPVCNDLDGVAEPDKLGPGVPEIPVAVDSGSVPAVSEENAEDRAVLLPEGPLEPLKEGELEPAGRDAEIVVEPDTLGPGVPVTPVAVDKGAVPAVSDENTEEGAVLSEGPEDSELEPAGNDPDTVAEGDVLRPGVPETLVNVDNGSVPEVSDEDAEDGPVLLPEGPPDEIELEPVDDDPDSVAGSDELEPGVPEIPVAVDRGSVPIVSEEIAVAVAVPLVENELALAGDDPEDVPELDITGPGVPETLVEVVSGSAVPEETPGTVAVPLPDTGVEVRGSLAVVPGRVPEEVAVLLSETPIDVDNGSVAEVSEVISELVAVPLPDRPVDVPGIMEETPDAVTVPL